VPQLLGEPDDLVPIIGLGGLKLVARGCVQRALEEPSVDVIGRHISTSCLPIVHRAHPGNGWIIGCADRPTARAAVTEAVARRQPTRAADETARVELEEAIRNGHRAGLSQRELTELTGLHRNSVAKIVGDTQRD
jgi:hypothetical protein